MVNGQRITFKLDTGAAVTAIPATLYTERRHGTLTRATKNLCGPSNTPIEVRGQFNAIIEHKGKTTKRPVFVIPGLATPLLGLPAIQELQLLSTVDSIQELSAHFQQLYPKVFAGLGRLKDEYRIKLMEGARPYALSLPRCVPLPMTDKVKEGLQRMEHMGVIAPIEEATEWCSWMVAVPKPNGKIKICVDLTHLNENVCRERYILPAVDETLVKFSGATVFTKLDATAGFWQIPLHADSSPLTTFITPFGRYCFRRLPFGISSAPEHFQSYLTQMLSGLEGTICHADDILVFRASREEHDDRLHKVLERLQGEGLTLNDKCQFSVDQVTFLGHVISARGIEADPDKIKAISEMPLPKDVAEVRRFMGMVNYVGKFSPHIAELTRLIRDLLKADRLDFLIRTDHKPLIPLLGSRALDDLPPRILRFRLQLLRFTYRIVHVPGKDLVTADALSRAPLHGRPTTGDMQLEKDVKVYVNHVIQHLPASEGRLAQIQSAQDADDVCKQLKNLVLTG
ncbi:hypothetical protein SKAU_G00353200 [Synaphobranchus kaupii]|uniref:ribonuclease H n=1 Tax=Synaphobranchus kaupii TaxID=118154 RepID=A0A9Q1EL14_SYNKA|nr:hypothetical protein SKAU_G00353200 [Synaphobranchus kaupii]